jgi:hypothetical protein
MGFSFHSICRIKRAEECWNESHTIKGSPRAPKTKEKPAGLRRRVHRCSRGVSYEIRRLIKTVAARG